MDFRRRVAAASVVIAALALSACGTGEAPEGEGFAHAGGQEGDSSFSYTPPPATWAHGIDVSYYEGTINWPKVRAAGKDFAFIRVSDGGNHTDSKFATNWAGARSAGVIRGAYQFFRPGQSATTQANLLLSKMGTLEDGDLPPTLDVEVTDGYSASHIRAGIATWVSIVSSATGMEPIIYTSPGFWEGLGEGSQQTILWDAHWRVSNPRVPPSWDDWTFWQYTDNGTVNGISAGATLDLNVFHGTVAELQAWAGATPNSTPTPTPMPTSTATPMPTATPMTTGISHGVDVSTYDGTVNWAQVKAAGKDFAFVRVSFGTAVDDQFAANWSGTKNAGVVRGAFQLFRPDQSATSQANLLLSKMGSPQPGDLPPVLDVELSEGMSASSIRSGISTWSSIVTNAIGREPIIRTTPGFWDNLGVGAEAKPLWVVHWGVSSPQSDLPTSWTAWHFWQYTASGNVSGIPGSPNAASLDEFNGSQADLMTFAN